MASITIKNVPADLHHELKEMAERSGRSLNQEILLQLRCAVTAVPRPEDVEAQIAAVERHGRELLATGYQPLSGEEVVQMIRRDRESH